LSWINSLIANVKQRVATAKEQTQARQKIEAALHHPLDNEAKGQVCLPSLDIQTKNLLSHLGECLTPRFHFPSYDQLN